MKKNWLTLLALACSVALFTACSDDDEPARASVDTVNGTYTSTDTEKQLALTYGDAVMTGKSVTFNSADGQSATITLTGAANTLLSGLTGQTVNNPGVIPGEASTTLNVTLVPQGETGYTFSGTDQSNDRTVAYTGSVEAGKLTLDVDVTFASNELTGTWNLVPTPPADDPSATLYPIYANWESDVKFFVEVYPGWNMELEASQLLNLALRMPIIGEGDAAQSVNQMLSAVLQSVTFGTDGNVIASYSDAADVASPSWQNSPAGMVQYCVKNGQLLVYLDIDKIMALASGGTSTLADGDSSGDLLTLLLPTLLSHIGEIAPMLSQGIPLDYGFDDNGMLTVSMGQDGLGGVVLGILKELMNNEAVLAALVEQAESNPNFAQYADALTQIPDVLNATTNFAIGLNFNPASAE